MSFSIALPYDNVPWIQVVKHEQLLDTANDYFQFVTRFFEVIKVSATHIYHSALELCPTSSIVRKRYYHRRVTQSPKVVIGVPESWARGVAISRKEEQDGLCIWSPCGQFVAATTRRAVEIRNQLTLELITILQPPETIPDLKGSLAYSPDGRSIACTSNTAIIIWDIQTGGVATEIKRRADFTTSLVWSSDGGTICTIDSRDLETFTVNTYDVSSGTASSPGTLQSGHGSHLWTVDGSFRVMTTVCSGREIETIDIFEVGSTLTKFKSFSPHLSGAVYDISFSPTIHRISVLGSGTLSVSDTRNSEVLLRTEGEFFSQCFSSDGSLFAARQGGIVCVWKYDSGHYALCRKFQLQGAFYPLQFSPTPSSSILGNSKNILQVLRLHELPTAPEIHRQQYVGLSRSGTRVATAHEMESTIITTDVLARTPPQFIDMGVAIERLLITGNVLLVMGSGRVVAWLLTEEGLVDGVIGDRRVGRGDSIWTVPSFHSWREVQVEGKIGVIKPSYGGPDKVQMYRTDTGEVLHPIQDPNYQPPGVFDYRCITGGTGYDYYPGRTQLQFHNLSRRNTPLEDRWKTSLTTVREGWVKDAEGKHRLWVPVEWRTDWDPKDWLHDVTAQFSYLGNRPVIVKF